MTKKVTELPDAATIDGTEELPVVQSGASKRATVAELATGIIVKDSPTDVRHPDFGGIDRTGSTDASATIQEAIDYITGSADPTTTTRSARSPLYIPKGYYKITEPIRVTSTVGFHMYGDGKEQTMFEAVGTMDRVFDFNGVSRSSFGDFSIYGHGTESITDAIHCRRNDTSRSTNYSTLYNIAIAASLRCVRGINIGEAGINTQNDTWMLSDLEIIGSFTPGETTWWQEGIKVGTGAFNNNLNHHGYDLNVPGWRRCFHIAACQFALFGFESGEGEADFYVGEHTYYLVVIGGRSEGSNRMVEQATTGGSPGAARFEDIDWKANSMHADGKVVSWRYGGSLHLKNCRWFYGTVAGATPRLETLTSGNKLDVTVDGCSAVASLKDFLTNVDSTSQVHLRNGWAHIALDGTLTTRTYGSIDVSGGAATDVTHRNRLKGDDYDRYQLTVDGSTYRGDGTAAPGVVWKIGTGTPEAAVTAPVGSLFTRTNGGAATTLYVKESGSGNTGWVAK